MTLPAVFTRIIKTDVPWYYAHGARHFHYMHLLVKLWGTWSLNQYLLSKILWNVDIDADSLI